MTVPGDTETGHERSLAAAQALARLVPGGAHTYAKGPDQYPEHRAPVILRGSGAHVWDVDGHEYVEYGSGLRSVVLGHADPRVTSAVRRSLDDGTNFVRPSLLELQTAERFLALFDRVEMVKFTKNGSDATTAAVRLARAVTGRDLVAVCRDHPFFSTDDWFIATTPMAAGIPQAVRDLTVDFPFDDVEALATLLERHAGHVAAIVMEAATSVEPSPGYHAAVRELCDRHGVLLVIDEMITGFRWHRQGACATYDIHPDLVTYGKALGNGFAVSALAGRREHMERGGLPEDGERVFLLSTTHGAESVGLAAAGAVLEIYEQDPPVATLRALGERLARGVAEVAAAAGVGEHVITRGHPANLVYATLDAEGLPSQEFRTLFLQELLARGVLAPSFVVSAALTDDDIARTVEAVAGACRVYARALEDGVDAHLHGRPVKPVFRSRT